MWGTIVVQVWSCLSSWTLTIPKLTHAHKFAKHPLLTHAEGPTWNVRTSKFLRFASLVKRGAWAVYQPNSKWRCNMMECYSCLCLGTIPFAGCHKGSGLFAKSWLTIAANSIKRESSRDQVQGLPRHLPDLRQRSNHTKDRFATTSFNFIQLLRLPIRSFRKSPRFSALQRKG